MSTTFAASAFAAATTLLLTFGLASSASAGNSQQYGHAPSNYQRSYHQRNYPTDSHRHSSHGNNSNLGRDLNYRTEKPRVNFRVSPTWHNTSHYDYHPGTYARHGNHFHYQPGHLDFHRTGHWHN